MKKLLFAALGVCALGATAQKTDVMFFLDTEDYTTSRSDDSIIELATLFQEEGVVANFDVVGFLVQKLIENRRYDILDAIKTHAVGTQSLYHSLHPTDCELADTPDAREAYRRVHERESIDLGMVRAGFGMDEVKFMTMPGNSFSYIAGNVAYDLGMVAGLDVVPGAQYGMWYANLFMLPYHRNIECYLPPNPEPDLKKQLDEWAKMPYVGLSMHPDKLRSMTHWDIVNYPRENLCKWREWKEAPRRKEADVQEFYRRLRVLIRALKADGRFNVTDASTVIATLKPRREIVPADLPQIETSLKADFGPVKAPASYCVADVFQAAVRFLRGEKSSLPGKALGFLEKPVGVTAPTVVKAAALKAAAEKLDLGWYIPPSIAVGDATIGPADFLFAALEVLRTGADEVTVSPREQLGSFAAIKKLETFDYSAWPIHSKSLNSKMLSDRLRYQLWTLRYEW